MLDGDALAAGEVRVLGVFTTFRQQSGLAFGESIDKAKEMLAGIAKNTL